MDIEKRVVELLKDKKLHISFAESCTGGLAAAKIINIPDASKVFDMGFITYSNNSKTQLLGVPPLHIKQFGVVSSEVAAKMAEGAAKAANAEIGVGISGIAGPTGETDKKAIGTVCFGFFINGKTITYCEEFGNIGRNNVREKSVNFAYERLVKLLD